jgi:hypothetical protein
MVTILCTALCAANVEKLLILLASRIMPPPAWRAHPGVPRSQRNIFAIQASKQGNCINLSSSNGQSAKSDKIKRGTLSRAALEALATELWLKCRPPAFEPP